MSIKTKNLELIKPDGDDFYNVEDFNINADIVDENLGRVISTVDKIYDVELAVLAGSSNNGETESFQNTSYIINDDKLPKAINGFYEGMSLYVRFKYDTDNLTELTINHVSVPAVGDYEKERVYLLKYNHGCFSLVNSIPKPRADLLFSGMSTSGTIVIKSDYNIYDYSFLVMNISSNSSQNPFGYAMLPVVANRGSSGSTSYQPVVVMQPASGNAHSTYVGSINITGATSIVVSVAPFNLVHTRGTASHGGATTYGIARIWGVR